MFRSAMRAWLVGLREKGDVYHFHDPELLPGGIVAKLFGKKVIYDVHEDYSQEILTKEWLPTWMRPTLVQVVRVLELVGAMLFDGIVAATPSIAAKFPRGKTVIVENFPSEEDLPIRTLPAYESRPRNAVYIGSITRERGIVTMVEAAALFPKGTKLVLVGTFEPKDLYVEVARLAGFARVQFLGELDREGVAAALAAARVGLLVLRPTGNHYEALPNKLFEYMAAGLPVVASDFPVWRKTIEEHKCGITVDPDDPRAVAEAVQWLMDHPQEARDMGMRGKKAVEKYFNWGVCERKLLAFYRDIEGTSVRKMR